MTPLLYSIIPFVAALLGGFIASLYKPKSFHTALLQYFVAGIVIAAVSSELLPKILETPSWRIGIGFVIGVAIMVALHELAHLLGHSQERSKLPLRLIGASSIDLFIDGVLIGLSFLAGRESGFLIALSLAPCAFFMTLTVSQQLIKKFYFILFLALMLPLGALVGYTFASSLPEWLLHESIAASVAALLYLAVEEFLVEAHKKKENHWVPLAFFFGFLIVLLFRH
jgi:ZIP family zinc transporter